jgi:hypothetical protein
MRTAQECVLKADDCERRARACADTIDRAMMLVTAQRWLNLAMTAEFGRDAPPTRQRLRSGRSDADGRASGAKIN